LEKKNWEENKSTKKFAAFAFITRHTLLINKIFIFITNHIPKKALSEIKKKNKVSKRTQRK